MHLALALARRTAQPNRRHCSRTTTLPKSSGHSILNPIQHTTCADRKHNSKNITGNALACSNSARNHRWEMVFVHSILSGRTRQLAPLHVDLEAHLTLRGKQDSKRFRDTVRDNNSLLRHNFGTITVREAEHFPGYALGHWKLLSNLGRNS